MSTNGRTNGKTDCEPRRYYVQRKDTCPTVIPRIGACGKLVGCNLIFGYMVQWQQIHRIAEGQRTTAFHCTMYLLPLDHLSKNQLSTNQNLLYARANSRNGVGYVPFRWACIALHSVRHITTLSIVVAAMDGWLDGYSLITILSLAHNDWNTADLRKTIIIKFECCVLQTFFWTISHCK